MPHDSQTKIKAKTTTNTDQTSFEERFLLPLFSVAFVDARTLFLGIGWLRAKAYSTILLSKRSEMVRNVVEINLKVGENGKILNSRGFFWYIQVI